MMNNSFFPSFSFLLTMWEGNLEALSSESEMINLFSFTVNSCRQEPSKLAAKSLLGKDCIRAKQLDVLYLPAAI